MAEGRVLGEIARTRMYHVAQPNAAAIERPAAVDRT